MALSTRRERRARRRRRLIAAVALLGQLVATLGLPIPTFAAPGKDVRNPYPCMNHPCGCRSAEECWAGCCCLTNAEKVAWAEANGVEIPDSVRAAAAREKATTSAKRCCKCAEGEEEKDVVEQTTFVWVLGASAARCHGHGPAALFQAVPAMPVYVTPNRTETPVLVDTMLPFDISPKTIGVIPADPPPRAC